MEPPGAAGAGIEPEDAVPLLLHIPVGVAEHHHVHTGKLRRDLLPVVDQEEGDALQSHCAVVGKLLRPLLVIVAPDDIEGGVFLQLIQNTLPVDVPAVENGAGVLQALHHLRPQEAVGVG